MLSELLEFSSSRSCRPGEVAWADDQGREELSLLKKPPEACGTWSKGHGVEKGEEEFSVLVLSGDVGRGSTLSRDGETRSHDAL